MKTNTDKTNPHAKVFLLIAIQILCLHSFVVNAQRIFSTSYTMDDGLAANRVYSILQDSCGFMWFGTDDGFEQVRWHLIQELLSIRIYQRNNQ